MPGSVYINLVHSNLDGLTLFQTCYVLFSSSTALGREQSRRKLLKGTNILTKFTARKVAVSLLYDETTWNYKPHGTHRSNTAKAQKTVTHQ